MTVAGRLAERVLVGDGGMGSLLSLELPELRFPEEANLAAPEAVLAAHVGFIRAGADVIQTNTYGANRRQAGCAPVRDIRSTRSTRPARRSPATRVRWPAATC